MQVKKREEYIMGKFDANHDISDRTLKKVIAEKQTMKKKLFKPISIRLNSDTLQKLQTSGKGWQSRLRDAIDKLVENKAL